MYCTLYTILVIIAHPTIPTDLKVLGDSQFTDREAATKRLESLPGWTALFFKQYASKAKNLGVRSRSDRVYRKLDLKWKADVILALFPAIPENIKAMGYRQSYKVREAATKRLESLPGLTASYFKYRAEEASDPTERDRCELLHKKLDRKMEFEWGLFCLEIHSQIKRTKVEAIWQKRTATMVANLGKLSAEDLKLVEAQRYCPIRNDVSLGVLGVPVKITLKGQPVFLCCMDCIKKAQANPDKTLADLKEVKKMGTWTKKQLEEKLKHMTNHSEQEK